jgi:chaperone BCS1
MEILENIMQGKQINTDVIVTMIVSLYGVTILMFLFKSIPDKIIKVLMYHFTTSLFISSMDKCYFSLIKLFQSNNIVRRSRSIRLVNGAYGNSNIIDKSIGPGVHYFFYKKIPIKIRYELEKTMYSDEKIHIALTKFGRNHKLFDDLLKDLQALVKIGNDPNKISIYNFNHDGHYWNKETSVLKRDFNTIFIEDDIKDRLFNHLNKFYENEKWYHERGIPYQTGICLYGPAGTGKTSIVKGLASHFNKELCILRSSEMDRLPYALKCLPSDSFIVIEDIDTSSIVMERNPEESLEDNLYKLSTKGNDGPRVVEETAPPAGKPSQQKDTGQNKSISEYSKVLFSDVLNAIDGIISIDKRVIIFTTNHLEKLDKALIRPGRIDLIERIDYISFEQFIRFCCIFYKDTLTSDDEEAFKRYSFLKHHVTVAELQRNFMQGMKFEEMLEIYCK